LENTDIQREAADGLSFHAEQAAPATGVLIHLLASSDAEVRIRSAGALHMIGAGGVAAAPTLRVMLRDDPNDTARVVACYAIGSVDPHNSDTLSVMIPALADRYATVREVAVEQIAALGQAGAGAESRIRSLLLDPDDRVREAAGRAIKAIVPNER
jgi:HEAT repeat protein